MIAEFAEASFTETGRREGNEDRLGSARSADGRIRMWAVADGLGGHSAGEVAATIAIERCRAAVENSNADDDLATVAAACFTAAMQGVTAARHGHEADMATTLVALFADGENVLWGHIGDSRLYRVRNGETLRLTRDHTVAESMRALSGARAAEPTPHADRLLAAVGTSDGFYELAHAEPLLEGDLFVLCSDGAWSHVQEHDLASLARDANDAASFAEGFRSRIIAADRVEQDNFTALAVVAGAWPRAARKERWSLRRIVGR